MLDPLVSEYLKKIHRLQLEHAEEYNLFSVEVRYDDYYGSYIYVVFDDDYGKRTASFIECVDEEDFNRVYNQLKEAINEER